MYRALKTFSGLVSMVEGEVKEISNLEVVKDLLNCGYIEAVEETTPAPKETPKATRKGKKTPKGG